MTERLQDIETHTGLKINIYQIKKNSEKNAIFYTKSSNKFEFFKIDFENKQFVEILGGSFFGGQRGAMLKTIHMLLNYLSATFVAILLVLLSPQLWWHHLNCDDSLKEINTFSYFSKNQETNE